MLVPGRVKSNLGYSGVLGFHRVHHGDLITNSPTSTILKVRTGLVYFGLHNGSSFPFFPLATAVRHGHGVVPDGPSPFSSATREEILDSFMFNDPTDISVLLVRTRGVYSLTGDGFPSFCGF
jgi:hypothetical protein